jgi:hypothetical protein
MAEARGPDLLGGPIFRSQPERALRSEEHADFLVQAESMASALQCRQLSVPGLAVLTPQHVLQQVAASSPASVFSLPFASIWISPSFSSCAKSPFQGISSSRI